MQDGDPTVALGADKHILAASGAGQCYSITTFERGVKEKSPLTIVKQII